MADRLQRLLETARSSCPVAVWSRGVELSRAGAVTGEGDEGDEATFLVSYKGGMISRTVTLFPDDAEWECECTREEAACEHVAASVLAWRDALARGEALPSPRFRAGRVGYRFTRGRHGLELERAIVRDGEDDVRLDWTLAAVAAGRVDGPRVVAAQADLAVELTLGTHRRGLLAPNLVPKLFSRLKLCPDVTLDGEPVGVDDVAVGREVVVSDAGDGFDVRLRDADAIDESFANGVVRCGARLHPRREPGLTGRELHDLTAGRYVPPGDAGELVSTTLPHLERTVPVVRRTERLPEVARERPRVVVDVDGRDRSLSVLARVVYGDPPRASVVDGRLQAGAGRLPLRDLDAEARVANAARQALGIGIGRRVELDLAEAIAFRRRLADWPGEVRGDAAERFRLAPPLRPEVRIEGDAVQAEFRSEGGRADPVAVVRAWQAGESLAPLLEGGFAPLPEDWLGRHGRRLADLLAARDAAGRLPASARFDAAELADALGTPPPTDVATLRARLEREADLPPLEAPPDLTATLRDYQRDGVRWLALMRDAGLGALLADDMGLGKTLQAACVLGARSLVVAPTSVLHNWRDELARFRPALRVAVYHGPGRRLEPDADVTLTTYAILRLDADALADVEWDTAVLDEAQAIKNPDSQVAAAAGRLRAAHRVTLTGTPVENRLEELWSQMRFLNPGLLGGRDDFRERYAQPIAAGDEAAAAALRRRTRPFVLRRLKRDVAPELPPRTDVVLRCELGEDERELYEGLRLAGRREVVAKLEAGGSVLEALELLLRLRQACCHTALVPGQTLDRSSKLDLLGETLDEVVAEGHRALVFSQWTSLLDRVEPRLDAYGIGYERLDGATADRAGVVGRFQSEDGAPVLLLSLRAGGTGLNLTRADHIFLLDPWWNPAVEDQAADRAHRIGQTNPVMVYRLVAAETVEEKILELQAAKRDLARAALGEAAAAGGLSRDDLLGLLA